MAVADEQVILSSYFPDATIPRAALAPPGTLAESAWRSSLNVAPYDGVLRRRPAAVINTATTGPTYSLTSATEYEMPLLISGSSGVFSAYSISTSGAPCASYGAPPTNSRLCVLITTRRIWVFNDASGTGTWRDCTPTYATGTVTATNGSATVTGVGTLWLTSAITAYQHITIDGTTYEICTVVSNTSLTLKTNFTGATGAGKAYSILRNWNLARAGVVTSACNVYATIYNGDLYVAGTYLGKGDSTISPCVIRVSDIYGTAPTSTYLTGIDTLIPGLDTIPVLLSITGLKCLQDGRVVFTGNDSTVYYSSHLNTSVWTVTPGGNTPVSFLPGAIQALGQIGPTLTLHYETGIVRAEPTGQADPPLAFRASAATEGCYAPRTLITIGAAEFYTTTTGNVARFDGESSELIGEETRHLLLRDSGKEALRSLFAGYEPNRREYQIFKPANSGTTDFYSLRLESGSWWAHRVEGQVSAAGREANPFDTYDSASQLLGFSSVSTAGSERPLLWTFSGASLTDNITGETTSQGGFLVETDDLNFGMPLVSKALQRVVVWVRTEPEVSDPIPVYAQSMQVMASIDAGQNWVTKTRTLVGTISERPYAFWFRGDINGAAHVRIRVRTEANTVFSLSITRLLVEAVQGGDLASLGLL